jgi:hypothetical protein
MRCFPLEVGTGFLNIVQTSFGFKKVTLLPNTLAFSAWSSPAENLIHFLIRRLVSLIWSRKAVTPEQGYPISRPGKPVLDVFYGIILAWKQD